MCASLVEKGTSSWASMAAASSQLVPSFTVSPAQRRHSFIETRPCIDQHFTETPSKPLGLVDLSQIPIITPSRPGIPIPHYRVADRIGLPTSPMIFTPHSRDLETMETSMVLLLSTPRMVLASMGITKQGRP